MVTYLSDILIPGFSYCFTCHFSFSATSTLYRIVFTGGLKGYYLLYLIFKAFVTEFVVKRPRKFLSFEVEKNIV